MTIRLDHTIVPAKDKVASAEFFETGGSIVDTAGAARSGSPAFCLPLHCSARLARVASGP
jgi:hypothetical protein